MKSDHHSNGHEHVSETADVSHIRSVDVTHELADVNIAAILKFLGGLTVMTIAVYLLMWGMFRMLNSQETSKEAETPPSPLAMSTTERLPPEPRLQSAPGFAEALEKEAGVKEGSADSVKPKDPLWEINLLRGHWTAIIDQGVKDTSGNVVVMPITDAKKELLKQGLPVRANGTAENDFALPTAASSGRETAGRQ
jgi:hypothetical protein